MDAGAYVWMISDVWNSLQQQMRPVVSLQPQSHQPLG